MPNYHYQSDARAFSQVIEDLGAREGEKLYMGELVDAFGERGFGALLVFFGLLNALPLPPGSTTLLGMPLLLLGFQLASRADQVWMPKWALKTAIDRETYRGATGRILPAIRRLERLSRPRLLFMTSEVSEILIGLACILLAVIVVLPIWGGNMAPSIIMAAFGFGLMQRDGAAVILGWIGVAGFAVFLWLAWSIIVRVLLLTLENFHVLWTLRWPFL